MAVIKGNNTLIYKVNSVAITIEDIKTIYTNNITEQILGVSTGKGVITYKT